MDETYNKVRGQWKYLYRAVDKAGQTIDFLLAAQRDEHAATRFLTKAIRRHGVPEKVTLDGSEANAVAIRRYNDAHGTSIAIRPVKYLNNSDVSLASCRRVIEHSVCPAAYTTVLTRYSWLCARSARAIRAFLLADATAARFFPRRAMSALSH
jgi:transposase-like protein